MHWLEPIFSHTGPGSPTLVLCRTNSSVQYVRQEALRRGGCIGLDILTPLGLALAVGTTSAAGDSGDQRSSGRNTRETDTELSPDYALVRGLNPEPLPEGHPWKKVEGRSGLQDRLVRHAAMAHLEQLQPLECPTGLDELVRVGWARPVPTHPLLHLLRLARNDGLPEDYCHDRVFAVGFGSRSHDLPEPPGPQRYHRRLLNALRATRLAGPARAGAEDGPEGKGDEQASRISGKGDEQASRPRGEGGDEQASGPEDCRDEQRRAESDAEVGKIQCVQASDVVAEARWVAARCAHAVRNGTPEREILVLVPGAGDASRIRAALRRNGVTASRDDHRRLSEHGLGALLRILLRFFSEPDPTLSGESLRSLFTTRLMDLTWPRDAIELQARTWCFLQRLAGQDCDLATAEQTLAGEDRRPRLSRRRVHDVLRQCHLRHAPVSVWRAALEQVAVEDNRNVYNNVRGAAYHMARLVEWLGRIRSSHETPVMGMLFEAVAGLGADWRDPISRGLLNALRAASEEALQVDVLEHILASSTSVSRVDDGVRILTVSRYDGRPAKLLLCTGLHSSGLGAVPAPDPFFIEEQLALLGVYGGERYLSYIFRQVLAAAARAQDVFGCVCHRDATGRAVVPLRGLPLQIQERVIDNYGIHLPSPEQRARKALAVSLAAPDADDSEVLCRPGGGPERTAARNATLEWIRAGMTTSSEEVPLEPSADGQNQPAGVTENLDAVSTGDPEIPARPTAPLLNQFVEHYREQVPAAFWPWLGDAGQYPASHHSRQRSYSVSRLFRPLTHCLYQAYLSSHIRLRQRDELAEDLDARDVGNAIHDVLEQVGTDARWRVPAEHWDDAVQHLIARLRAETRLQMYPEDGPYTPAVRKAQEKLLGRWNQHWDRYVPERVVNLDSAQDRADRWARDKAVKHPVVGILAEQGDPARELTGRSHKNLEHWIAKAAAEVHHDRDPWDDYVRSSIAPRTYRTVLPAISRLRANETTQDQLRILADCYGEFLKLGMALFGPDDAPARAELGFGDPDEVELDLSNSHVELKVKVRGRIDRIRSTAHGEARAVQILDYKTGSAWYAREVDEDYSHGVKPQLQLYALALAQALEDDVLEDDLARNFNPREEPFILSYDYVQSPSRGYTEHVVGWDMPSLQEFSNQLRTLLSEVRQGHYPLIPHPRTCPHLQSWGSGDYCQFQDVCRLR